MSRARRVPGRVAVPVLTAAYGAFILVANARNDIITSNFTGDWMLFGGATGFPGDFGRNVFAGSIALGVIVLTLAAVTWAAAGRAVAAWPAGFSAALSLLLLATYRDHGNLLASKPSAAAVLLALALYLGSSASLRSGASQPVDEADVS